MTDWFRTLKKRPESPRKITPGPQSVCCGGVSPVGALFPVHSVEQILASSTTTPGPAQAAGPRGCPATPVRSYRAPSRSRVHHPPFLLEHEPNRDFLRALHALARAAGEIGEQEEYERCSQFLKDSSPTAAQTLG
ncbi:DUF3151 family protein [Streptomyces sp. NBC_00481]|nr:MULTISPECIES: DUF3151 family protein [unclassified Streptomyces]WRZ01495.1 DUF3151 family protein [Streptomyces sp. NBC_00481]